MQLRPRAVPSLKVRGALEGEEGPLQPHSHRPAQPQAPHQPLTPARATPPGKISRSPRQRGPGPSDQGCPSLCHHPPSGPSRSHRHRILTGETSGQAPHVVPWGGAQTTPSPNRGQSHRGLALPGASSSRHPGPSRPDCVSFLGTVCRLGDLEPVSTPSEPLQQEHRRPLDKALEASEPVGHQLPWELGCRVALSSAPPPPPL